MLLERRMPNWHLPSHIAWVGYRHQLWPGLRYGLGTMTNDIEPAAKLLDNVNHKTLNVLGIVMIASVVYRIMIRLI